MGKELGQKNILIATLEQKVNSLEKKLELQKLSSRKAVEYNHNKRFAWIKEIAYAKWEAEEAPRTQRIKMSQK